MSAWRIIIEANHLTRRFCPDAVPACGGGEAFRYRGGFRSGGERKVERVYPELPSVLAS